MRLRWLHKILVFLLHVERRFEPFFRRGLNRLTRPASAAFIQWTINFGRKDEGLDLAEERLQPGEEEDNSRLIEDMRLHLDQDFKPGKMERAGNTKTHGLVRGELIIHDDLPERFRRGIFREPGRRYRAWVRF
jgi:hypothetical protein